MTETQVEQAITDADFGDMEWSDVNREPTELT